MGLAFRVGGLGFGVSRFGFGVYKGLGVSCFLLGF